MKLSIDYRHLAYEIVMWVNFAIPHKWKLHEWWFVGVVLKHFRGTGGYIPGDWLIINGIRPLGPACMGQRGEPSLENAVVEGPLWALWLMDKFMRMAHISFRV